MNLVLVSVRIQYRSVAGEDYVWIRICTPYTAHTHTLHPHTPSIYSHAHTTHVQTKHLYIYILHTYTHTHTHKTHNIYLYTHMHKHHPRHSHKSYIVLLTYLACLTNGATAKAQVGPRKMWVFLFTNKLIASFIEWLLEHSEFPYKIVTLWPCRGPPGAFTCQLNKCFSRECYGKTSEKR